MKCRERQNFLAEFQKHFSLILQYFLKNRFTLQIYSNLYLNIFITHFSILFSSNTTDVLKISLNFQYNFMSFFPDNMSLNYFYHKKKSLMPHIPIISKLLLFTLQRLKLNYF